MSKFFSHKNVAKSDEEVVQLQQEVLELAEIVKEFQVLSLKNELKNLCLRMDAQYILHKELETKQEHQSVRRELSAMRGELAAQREMLEQIRDCLCLPKK